MENNTSHLARREVSHIFTRGLIIVAYAVQTAGLNTRRVMLSSLARKPFFCDFPFLKLASSGINVLL